MSDSWLQASSLKPRVALRRRREHDPARPPHKSGKGIPEVGAVGVDSSSIVAGPAAPELALSSAGTLIARCAAGWGRVAAVGAVAARG
jgi:hypothetical protein